MEIEGCYGRVIMGGRGEATGHCLIDVRLYSKHHRNNIKGWGPREVGQASTRGLQIWGGQGLSKCRPKNAFIHSLRIARSGAVARRYIKDPTLLRFIDCECYIWSTVNSDLTPIINAGMVFCDRHYGGINYPLGGVGMIAEKMAEGTWVEGLGSG